MVEIVEVSPRDGLQNEKVQVSTDDKVALVERSLAAGLRRMEVASFVNPKRVPQMADGEEVLKRLPRDAGTYIGLVLNRRGFDRAIGSGCHEINLVLPATDSFSQRNQGAPMADLLQVWRNIAAPAKEAGFTRSVSIAVSFGCPFEGEVPTGRVLDLVGEILKYEPDEIAFADTIGCGVPGQVRALLDGARALSTDVKLRCHFHNTRNTGIANAFAAVEAEVDALDSSIGGVGGCPFAPNATGNIATEDLVYMLERLGMATGINLDQLTDTARWLEGVLGKQVPGAVTRAGGFPKAA